MPKIFSAPSGNIAIAMLLMVIATMSGFTLSSLAMRDVVAFQFDFEGFQSMMLLRSEANRGQVIAQKLGTVIIPVRTSVRNVQVTNSALRKTFIIQSLLAHGSLDEITEDVVIGDRRQTTEIRSLVKSKTGIGQTALMNTKFSMIRKYGIYTVESETFAKFMYFTDTDASPSGANVYFYGADLTYGRVHSNTDIWIKKTTGPNDGWPTFMGLVSTTGHVQSASGTYNEEDVFQGGLSEEYPYTLFPEEASTIRRRNNTVGPLYYDTDHILYVEVEGTGYTAYLGEVLDPYREYSVVYNTYPPANPADSIWRNQYSVSDTMWSFNSNGSASNTSKWVNSKLWIKGTFQSYQTWGCADTMFLLDDILLSGTPVGNDPLNNKNDVVGLVSEKSIVIKYGYRHPVDSLRYHDALGPCDGPPPGNTGIWIYAAMAALGHGHGNTFKDGVFTFEYQHPHPSTPDILATVGGVPTMFTKIDLHRYQLPQTNERRWATKPIAPYTRNTKLDFPWYNPLWPERLPFLERGYISVYGSISQRRRGFVHRSMFDSEWPPGGNQQAIWDQPQDLCGASSAPGIVAHQDPVFGFTLTNVDAQGCSGGGVGYDKNYHYDNRFYFTSPIDFPEVQRDDGTALTSMSWVIKRPPENL